MSDPDAFETPDSPPPPSYELCQQEFDEKIARALEASQRDQIDQLPAIEAEVGEDGWQIWSDAVCAAAAARLSLMDDATNYSSGQSSSACGPSANTGDSASRSLHIADATSHLHDTAGGRNRLQRINTKQPSAKEKERPSWYTDARLGDGPSANPPPASSTDTGNSAWPQNASSGRSTPRTPSEKTPTPERVQTPPPEFEEVGPDLDGPPYEAYEPEPTRGRGVVLTYVPGDSNPPSPLASPTIPDRNTTFSNFIPPISLPQAQRRRLPTPPTQTAPAPPHSVSPSLSIQSNVNPAVYNFPELKHRYGNPRVAFDPRVAYTGMSNQSSITHHEEPHPSSKVHAGSFYK